MIKTGFIKYFLIVLILNQAHAFVRSQTVDHWETVIMASDTWHYFPGMSEPPSDWPDIGFDDSSWLSGPGGIGYGNDDDATVISPVTSLYLRTYFLTIYIRKAPMRMVNILTGSN